MEALRLQDAAYVRNRYAQLQESKLQSDQDYHIPSAGECVSEREVSDEERLELERWRIVQRAKALDAKGPMPQLQRKLIVLQDVLEQLYAPKGADRRITSPSNSALKRLETGDPDAPVALKELPVSTQVALQMFFRMCQSLREPTKVAANCRLSVQIASKLPTILTSMPSCVLSPGLADDGSLESEDGGNVWSVFYQLFRLFEELLGLNDAVGDRTTVCLSASDRATVIIAYVALSLKWGRLGYLIKGVRLLLESEDELNGARFEPLWPLLRDLAATAVERPQVAFGEEEQPCGYLMSFGKGDHGKLGHGQCVHVSCQEGNCTENKTAPTMIAATRDVLFRKIDSLSTHSIAITAKGEAMAWGNGDKYRLGHGSSAKEYTPRTIEFLGLKGRVRDLACGLGHTLALMESGELFAWGNGSNGRLGLGDMNDRSSPAKVVVPASPEKQEPGKEESMLDASTPVRFRHIFCGASHSLGLSWDGRAYAWGKNNQGQCGHGHTNDQLTIQEIESFRDSGGGEEDECVVFAAGGWEHTLFCTDSGRVYSCGCGYKDSRRAGIPPVLGHGDCDRRLKPTLVQALEDVREEIVKVACGWDHSLAVSSSGRVYTWGSGTNGKLGHGDEESFDIPTPIRSMEGKRVKDAKAGCEHTVFLTNDNELWTCGQGDSGRLGHGDNQTRKRPTKIELFAECGLKPVALAVGDKYNLVLVKDGDGKYEDDTESGADSTQKSAHWVRGFTGEQIPSHGVANAPHGRHRTVQHNSHAMQFGAHWVLNIAERMESKLNPATGTASTSKEDFMPDSPGVAALFIAGHMDRLASDYITDEQDAKEEKRQESRTTEANTNVQSVLLPFAADTSYESLDALLQLLRWTTSFVDVKDKSVRSEKHGSDTPTGLHLANQARLSLTLSCLRILQLNLKKSLDSVSMATQSTGRVDKAFSKRSSLFSRIHELLDSLGGLKGDEVVGRLYHGARRSGDKQDLLAVASAISQEAACALKMGFGMFYPTGSSRCNLLWEVLDDCKLDVPSMRTIILSDQLCQDSIMTEILKYLPSNGLLSLANEVPGDTQNENSSGKDIFEIKSLMVVLLKRSSADAIKHLDNEAFTDFTNEPDCFLRLLHVLQTHYFSIVHQSAFQQYRTNEKSSSKDLDPAISASSHQIVESLLEYVDALMAEALVVLKRLHKGSRQHEEIITWRLNGSFFHTLLSSALECLSVLLSSQTDVVLRSSDHLLFVERVLPNLIGMLKMLDEVSWKMHSAGDGGNQTHDSGAPPALRHTWSASLERNWFVDLGNACAVLCGKLSCELFYSSALSTVSTRDIARHGAYYSLVLSEGRLFQTDQVLSKTSEVSSMPIRTILEWEHLGVFEVEDELVGSKEEPTLTGSTGSMPHNASENQRFLLQLGETDFSGRPLSFWGWIASVLSLTVDLTSEVQRLLTAIVSVSSWHLGLTDELRHAYELYEVDSQSSHSTNELSVSPTGKVWEVIYTLLDGAINVRWTSTDDLEDAVKQSRLLLNLRPNPALVPHELCCGINQVGTYSCRTRTEYSISDLVAFLTKPVDTDFIQRYLLAKELDASLVRTGICILHDLLRKLTTSSAKSCLLDEFVAVACATNRMGSTPVASMRKIKLDYEQDKGIVEPIENLFVRLARIVSSEDASFELKKKTLLAWTIPLGHSKENTPGVVALIAKSGIMSTLVELLLDEANVLDTHSVINHSVAAEIHVETSTGENKWSSHRAGAESRLLSKTGPINALLFEQTPAQIISLLAWEAFCAISMQLSKSEQFAQHRPVLFLRPAESSLHDKEPLTPRSTSMSPRRRLTLPKKMVILTVDEIIEQMIDGLFLMLKGVRSRIDTLDASSQEYTRPLRPVPVNRECAERSFQQQDSHVFLFGHPVQISQTSTHDIRITRSNNTGSAFDSTTGFTLSFWLHIEYTGAKMSKPPSDTSSGNTVPSTNSRSNESSVQLLAFTRNQDTSMAPGRKGPELIVFTRDPHPDHISIGLSLRSTESTEDWCSFFVDERFAREKWIQVVFSFNKDTSDFLQVFVGGKRSTLNNGQRTVDSSKILFSDLTEKSGSWDVMNVGGNVDKDVLCVQKEEKSSSVRDFQQVLTTPKRPSHYGFAAVLDDVVISCGALSEDIVAQMQNSGTVLFRLKQQHIAEGYCGKLLRLLCQLVDEGNPKPGELSLSVPFSDRWITLFSNLVLRSSQHDQDLAQVYACYLLEDVLPRAPPLPEFYIQDLGQRLFSIRPGHGTKVEQAFNEFNEQIRIPSTSMIRRQNEGLHEMMQEHGILHKRSRGENASGSDTLSDETAVDVMPLKTKTSMRFAAASQLLQKLCLAPSWRDRMDDFIGNSIAVLQGSESLENTLQAEESSAQKLADLHVVINIMAGYSEETLNDHRASVRNTALFPSQIQACRFPFDSVLHLDDTSIVAKVQALVSQMLKGEIRRTLSLPARKDALAKCHNDVAAVNATDQRIGSVLHLRAQVLRVLVANLLRENISAETSKKWHHFLLNDTAACEGVLQVASSCVKECTTTMLGPDSKIAMKLRRLRIFNKEVLRRSKHRRGVLPAVSFAELERLQWQLWEEMSTLSPSVALVPWWQQNSAANGNLSLEVVGGDVELCDLKVKALEHFPTVRLAQANICANSGLWFFEVTALTDGLMQIGYVDGDFSADPLQGQGVGDHTNSWAFDGFRCKKWNVNSYDYGEQWRADDVVGVLLDTDRMEISYFLNGKFLGVAFSGIAITASSRMCPAASLNVHQSAEFNFGAASIEPASEDNNQILNMGGFKHPPVLDAEDQARFRPIILALQTRQASKTDTTSNIDALDEVLSEDWGSSSSDEDSDTDDEEIAMEDSGNLSAFRRNLESGSRDGRETRTTDLIDEENGQRRRDLVEGLTGLGFPLEWATRCATETRLPMDETGAVAWILEQMEKVGLDGAISLPPSSTLSDDGTENRVQPTALWSTRVQLPNLVDSHSADDLAVDSSSLAVPILLERMDDTEIASDSTHQISQTPNIPVFQRLGTSEKPSAVSATINAFMEGEKDEQQSDDEGSEAFQQNVYRQRQINLSAVLHLSSEVQMQSTSKAEKQILDRKRSVDDLLPLGAAVDTTIFVAYARQAFTSLLLLVSHQEEQGAVYAMVRRLVLSDESSSRVIRFLRIAIGLDTMDAAFELDYVSHTFRSERSLQIQQAMIILLQYEDQTASRESASTDSFSERSPLLQSLCQEIASQSDRGLILVRSKQGNKKSADPLAINSAAAWFAWVSSLVMTFVESQLARMPTLPDVKAENYFSNIDVPLLHSTAFVETLVAISSSPFSSATAWKYVAFRLLSRIMFAVRTCSGLPREPPENLSSTAFFTSAQLPQLVELFTLRRRREMYSKIFFTDVTCTLFALLVSSLASPGRLSSLKTLQHSEKRSINLHVNNYSSTHVSISWEKAARSIAPESSAESSPDGSSNNTAEPKGEVDSDIVFLKVKRYRPLLRGCELSDTFDTTSSKALPPKGTYTIRNLLPNTQYLLQIGPAQPLDGCDTNPDANAIVNGAEVVIQTPPEPVFELDGDSMGKNIVVFNRNLLAKNTVNKKWHSVRASVAFEEGVHQWQVRLDTCVSKNIFIGVCTAEASMENYIGSDAYGYGFLANKAIWHNKAKLHSYGEIFKQGDVIQVTLDCNAKTLAFSRNGEYLGIAASNMRAGPSRPGLGGSVSTDGSCKWYPAFSVYNKDDKLTLIPPSAASIFSSQEGCPQNASTFELIESMQDVLTYQSHVDSNAKLANSNLFEKAFEAFEGWRREEQTFREISLGQVIAIDKSKSATDRYGLAAGDSVFTTKGQCTVLGEYRHELWYEVDEEGASTLFSSTTPQLASWSLSACREMLSSPDEYPVHRHHKYKLDLDNTVIESQTLDSTIEQQNALDNTIAEETFSFQAFVGVQERWGDNGIDAAEADAKLIAELDAITTSQAISSPWFLSFADVSTALLLEKMYAAHGISAEPGSNQTIIRIGLLLYVNRCLYHVVRLAMTRNTFATSLGTCVSPDATTNQHESSKQVPALCNTECPQVSPVAALLNSPHWILDDPSNFSWISALAARLLFSSQKEKLIEEELRRTKTVSRAPDILQEPSEIEDSSVDADLPTIKMCYPSSQAVPFWELSTVVPKQRRFCLIPSPGGSIFVQFSKQLAAQDARQWRRGSSQPFEAIPIYQSFQVDVEKPNAESSGAVVKDGEQDDTGKQQQDEDDEQLQQPSSKQTAKYLILVESATREVQSPYFPLFVPTGARVGASGNATRPELQLDINVELFSPSALAQSRVQSSQLLLWYYCFGQLLGIAWRSKLLLPLQFLSNSFWKELVDPAAPILKDEGDRENRSRVRDAAIRAIRDGLFSIIPSRCVALLSGTNPSLRERLSDLDVSYVARLERHATYSVPRQSHHDLFWKLVHAFTSVERRMLEQFVNPERKNGTKQIEAQPTSTSFVLEIADALSDGREHPDSCYPVVVPIGPRLSRLHLPAYSSAQTLRHKLLLAMTNIPFM